MFGLNVVQKVDRTTDSLLVHSIFPTIQGEGPYAGQRSLFVRLGGCSLACSWCDTEFEQDLVRMPNDALFEQIEEDRTKQRDPLLIITGGEPMRQDLTGLLKLLLPAGWRVQIETAGIHWNPGLENFEAEMLGLDSRAKLTIVCSPKTPKLNPILERYCTNYKYIINADELAADDGLPIQAVSQAHKPTPGILYRPRFLRTSTQIFVQPMHLPKDEDATQRNIERCVELVMQFGYRLSLQQHKLLGLP